MRDIIEKMQFNVTAISTDEELLSEAKRVLPDVLLQISEQSCLNAFALIDESIKGTPNTLMTGKEREDYVREVAERCAREASEAKQDETEVEILAFLRERRSALQQIVRKDKRDSI